MARENEKPWWSELPSKVGGDMIVANVGAGAQGVAVGKQLAGISQFTQGALTPDDRQIIEQRLAGVETALAQVRDQLDPAKAAMADFQIKLLRGELVKTGENETPSASAITQVGDWLLDNLPDIAEAVVGLFATPAVGKVVGKAGQAAIQWARRRFGGSVT